MGRGACLGGKDVHGPFQAPPGPLARNIEHGNTGNQREALVFVDMILADLSCQGLHVRP